MREVAAAVGWRAAKRCAAVAAASLALLLVLTGVGLAAVSTVTAVSGAFSTVLPSGFSNDIAAFSGSAIKVQIALLGPKVDGFAANINVVREHVGALGVGTLIDESISEIKSVSRAHDFSAVSDLSVDGAPARAVDYLAKYVTTLRQRQVYAVHDGWGYVITYSAQPGSQYQGSLSALHQTVRGWRWR